jgi:murein DD-endopeptidase MepM/ murein hydrolase activator NlpD
VPAGGRVVSKYMHLDFIRDDLAPGVEVRAGEWLGSLGRTGVKESGPHLHFEVQVRLSKKQQHRVDPEPLVRAGDVIGLLEMKVPAGTAPPDRAAGH